MEDGTLGVFFPCDGQLSEAMVEANDLYSEAALTKLGKTPRPGQSFGFFSEKRRVRAQRFRGEKSDGIWLPLSSLAWAGDPALLQEGDQFDRLYDQEVCRKYYTPATLRAQGQKVGRRQRENACFPKHDVTKQFKYVGGAIPERSVCWITEKLHGTSGRFGLVLDDLELPFWKRWINNIIPVFPTQAYRYLNGSKNVIISRT